jgi:hypothetical protein
MGRLDRMKHGSGVKGRDDRLIGIEILMSDSFDKINSTRLSLFIKKTRTKDKTHI